MSEKITRDEVRHVAALGRLELSPGDEQKFTGQLNDILKYIDKLNELDTTGVPATTHVVELRNVFREDEVLESIERDEALRNAPDGDGVNFVVPRVI